MRPRLITAAATVLAALAVTAGCGTDAPYQKRMDYLRVVAQRGADTHALLAAQDAAIDKKRCENAWAGLADDDEPQMADAGAFHAQVKQFFVDSCISGKPKPVPGQPVSPTPASVPVSPAPTPSR